MATLQWSGLIRQLRQAALAGDGGGLSDAQLLEWFQRHGDEAAFEALVRRHGPMVLGVCRRVLGDCHEAEDAFQATFLILLRKAGALASPERVGSWLHGVAYLTARNARVSRQRRQRLQRRLREMGPRATAAEPPESDLRPLLDEELGRLPERYRVPLVLCELEGRSRREAAAQLGTPEGTLSSRLARGRELLRRRLVRRGLALPAGGLASLLWTEGAPAAVPALLVRSTVQAATQLAAGKTAGALAGPVTVLLEGGLHAMFLTKLKLTFVVLLALGLLGSGGGLVTHYALADKPKPEKKPVAEAGKKPKGEGEGKKPGKETALAIPATIQSVNADKGTLTALIPGEPGKKERIEKTYALAPGAKVVLREGLAKNEAPRDGKLTDLEEGTPAMLQLSEDGKAVVAIHPQGRSVQGGVKGVDQANGTITLTLKGPDGPREETFRLARDARVLLSDGLSKKDKDQEGQLADVSAGTSVNLRLSVLEPKTALVVRLHGPSLNGTVKGVDFGSNTLTLTVKEDAQIVDKTLPLSKEVRVEGGNLTDLTAGSRVALTLSVLDRKTVVSVRRFKEDK